MSRGVALERNPSGDTFMEALSLGFWDAGSECHIRLRPGEYVDILRWNKPALPLKPTADGLLLTASKSVNHLNM